jgi:hypothetical protein
VIPNTALVRDLGSWEAVQKTAHRPRPTGPIRPSDLDPDVVAAMAFEAAVRFIGAHARIPQCGPQHEAQVALQWLSNQPPQRQYDMAEEYVREEYEPRLPANPERSLWASIEQGTVRNRLLDGIRAPHGSSVLVIADSELVRDLQHWDIRLALGEPGGPQSVEALAAEGQRLYLLQVALGFVPEHVGESYEEESRNALHWLERQPPDIQRKLAQAYLQGAYEFKVPGRTWGWRAIQ